MQYLLRQRRQRDHQQASTHNLRRRSERKATLTENSWQGLAVNENTITYIKGGTPLGAAPTDAGTYTASITLGEGIRLPRPA